LKAGQTSGIGGQFARQDLDRDLAFEPGVGRAMHLAHAACAKRRNNFVRSKPVANGERHDAGL